MSRLPYLVVIAALFLLVVILAVGAEADRARADALELELYGCVSSQARLRGKLETYDELLGTMASALVPDRFERIMEGTAP